MFRSVVSPKAWLSIAGASVLVPALLACSQNQPVSTKTAPKMKENTDIQPLVTHMYTADPSAHAFEGKIYIYPSHDWESGKPADNEGSHFDMRDYHVFSMAGPGEPVTDHGAALKLEDIPWASRQLWAPDAAHKDGKYYLYFPAKDKQDIFRLGVAVADNPAGPFKAQPEPIEGSYSIDPAVFQDEDGEYYIYNGGIWGGQLQRWKNGEYTGEDRYPADNEPALAPIVAKLSDDMTSLAEPFKPIELLDENGDLILYGDNERRFFEAAWVHKHNGVYYFTYSTGDTHKIAYATGSSPYGPFTYGGTVLNPVLGWTNHHSIVQFEGKWYLFFHDSSLSGGQTHLRSIKMAELEHLPDGSIRTIDALVEAKPK